MGRLKSKTQNDYDICQEHYGYEQACLERSENVYKYRQENDYKMLRE